MSIELRQLRYFIAVAEELHVGRAAIRLNMTQPPLSQSIQGLEALLGAPLFIRKNRGIILSSAGEALLPEAKKLIKKSQDLGELVKTAARGDIGALSLAFVSTADYNCHHYYVTLENITQTSKLTYKKPLAICNLNHCNKEKLMRAY